MTEYRSSAVHAEVEAQRRRLDAHRGDPADGSCIACHRPAPCGDANEAAAFLAERGFLMRPRGTGTAPLNYAWKLRFGLLRRAGFQQAVMVDEPEIELPKGDVTEGVVRVGDTVRRPHQPQSPAVAAYLHHLESVGFDGSPRYLGRDERGRDVLTYLSGEVPGDPPEAWAADDGLLASVAVLLRRLHEASVGFTPPADAVWRRDLVRVEVPVPDPVPELVSHNDVTPQNVVVRDGCAAGLVDFDLAGPTSRLLDVYNTAMHWVPLRPPGDVPPAWRTVDQPARLRLFADAYGLSGDERRRLPDLGVARADVTWLRMRAAAEQLGGGWARMWAEGVGDAIRRRQAWLRESRDALLTALE